MDLSGSCETPWNPTFMTCRWRWLFYSCSAVKCEMFTICWMRWKLLPWKLKACSNRTLSSTVHSSGNGVKLGRSARDFSMLCLCQKSMPSACSTAERSRENMWESGSGQICRRQQDDFPSLRSRWQAAVCAVTTVMLTEQRLLEVRFPHISQYSVPDFFYRFFN